MDNGHGLALAVLIPLKVSPRNTAGFPFNSSLKALRKPGRT